MLVYIVVQNGLESVGFLMEKMDHDFRPYIPTVLPIIADRLAHFIPYRYGAHSISVSRIVPHIVRLLGDPTSSVRDAAFNTLVFTYRHVGDRLRTDLQRKQYAAVPPSKMQALMTKFDELKESGDLLESASTHDTHVT
ncbi:hypothetical protein J437_LFUL009096, partial [Ladona fulva]